MTTTTDALRAVLARLDGDLTHRDRLRLHLADTGEDDRGAWNSPLMQDVLGEMDDMYAALAQAVEALEGQPPPADAGLLAAANRELMRLHEEQRLDLADVDRFRAMARRHMDERDEARARAEKAERAAEIAQLAARAARMETDEALGILARRTRERDEARAEVARLRAALDAEREPVPPPAIEVGCGTCRYDKVDPSCHPCIECIGTWYYSEDCETLDDDGERPKWEPVPPLLDTCPASPPRVGPDPEEPDHD